MSSQTGKNAPARALTSLELCAGGGGSALGLEQAGFSPVALFDNDPHACATLRHNRPFWNEVEADIQWLDSPYWSGVDLLSGGLPCPPFSIAGKQLGRDDDRDLFPAMLRIVSLVRPRAILIENVRGILAPRFTPFRERVDAALRAEGFDTHWALFKVLISAYPRNVLGRFLSRCYVMPQIRFAGLLPHTRTVRQSLQQSATSWLSAVGAVHQPG